MDEYKKLNSKVFEDAIKSVIQEDDLFLYKDLGNGLYKLPGHIIANQKGRDEFLNEFLKKCKNVKINIIKL